MSSDGLIRVFLVDDHSIVRSGLRLLIESHPGLVVAGEASSGPEALRMIDDPLRPPPDVVLMDLVMDPMSGVEATRRLKRAHPTLPVLMLTMARDGGHVRSAFVAGASGYVLKDAEDMELVQAINTVASGGRYLHPSLGAELVRDEARRGATAQDGPPLSPRETEVLRLVALGYSNQEVADELGISVRTVETHKAHIIQKTGLRQRSDLVRLAVAAGLVPAP